MSMSRSCSIGPRIFCGGLFILQAWLGCMSSAYAMPDIQHWQTSNGVDVYFVPAPELPMVDIEVIFSAGSARDGGQYGIASMTNNLIDKGADGVDADGIAATFEDLGAQFGTVAGRDMGVLTLRSLTDESLLSPALDMFYRVLNKPDFKQADFDRELKRTLISVQSVNQKPAGIASYRLFENVYQDHPYGHRPSGTLESLSELNNSDVRAFYKRYYIARNAMVVMTGDVDRKKAGKIAEQLVGKLPAGDPVPLLPEVKKLKAADEIRIEHPSSQTHIRMGAPGIRKGDPDFFALHVGNHVLGGGGMVSRLFEEIREKRGLSYGVYSYFRSMKQAGPYILSLQTRNDQVDEALGLMRSMLKEFHEKGPTEDELSAAKKNITGGFAFGMDSNSKIVGLLGIIGFYDLPLDYLDTYQAKIQSVTRAQVIDAFRRRVDPERMVTVIVGGSSNR